MKNVLITGCSKGIGKEITKILLSNNYSVIGCARNSNKFLDETILKYNNFKFIRADLSNNEIKNVLKEFEQKKIYALINNAGIGLDGILATLPVNDIDKLLNLNLRVPILLSRAMSRNIIKHKTSGRIINISSIISESGFKGLSVYSATKAGLNGLTLSLARELGKTGTTVNSILPGYIKTDMSNKLSDKQLKQILNRTPLGRLTDTKDVAELVLFLLSSKSESITGQTITIDSGTTV